MTETESMVERVAKAIREKIKVDATGMAPAVASAYIVGIDDAARAAIEAMKTPTDAMGDDGYRAIAGGADAVWQAMIVKALEE